MSEAAAVLAYGGRMIGVDLCLNEGAFLFALPLQMYVALFPCNECAKLIIQSGITEVIYLSDKYHERLVRRICRQLKGAEVIW